MLSAWFCASRSAQSRRRPAAAWCFFSHIPHKKFSIFDLLKKAFYILFAFYFLSLSVMPCNDEQDCKEAKHTEQVAQADNHEHENEVCTPFCVCSCCATHILFSNFSNDFSIDNERATVYTEPANAELRSAIISVWQPPKLTC